MEQTSNAAQPNNPAAAAQPDPDAVHVCIELDQAKRPQIKCVDGTQNIKAVALTPTGFNALIELDLMRAPKSLKVGALRNWVELDGQLFRFDDGGNGLAGFEKTLNERYVDETGPVQNVLVFANPASPTGFDLQFPACPHGFAENRRRHLKEETIRILQDPEKCRVLRKGIVVVLAPPQLIFKQRHPDLSETHLPADETSLVFVQGEDGVQKKIDLSQPVDLSNVTPVELAAVMNHPAVNRRAAAAAARSRQEDGPQREAA